MSVPHYGATAHPGPSPPPYPVQPKESAIDNIKILFRDHKTTLSVIVVFLLLSINAFQHLTRCPLYPEVRDQIRKDWDQEALDHEAWKDLWNHEIAAHDRMILEWEQDARRHEEDVQRRRAREDKEYEERREAWEKEAVEHRRALEERQRLEELQREAQRQRWRREVENHDRLEEERRKREEEERQKLNMFWDHPEPHQCTTYGTREYTARLMNLPVEWEHRVEACKATPIVIHGISYLPTACEDRGPGHVIGRWSVDQHEPDCNTFWNWYKDKGCTSPGSGKRRIEHYLEILPVGGDWREFCATTPARFLGLHFTGAHECFQYNYGTYGHWQIDDSSC